MGKAKTKAPPVESVTVRYDLFELPTAQHKAGLAGLLLQIQSMRDRQRHGAGDEHIPRVEATTTTATVRFTAASVQGVFDDLYDAALERVLVKSKWQGQEPVDTVDIEEAGPDGEPPRKSRRFVYEVVQPCGHFLRQHLPKMDPTKDWHKLWREMLWAVPRGRPLSRIPFEERAEGRHCGEGQAVWADLVRVEKARRTNQFHTTEVASSLWLGAQAFNAEAVPFQGRAEQSLLLHFWPLTVQVFAPQQLDADGNSDFVGYVLAIPEVSDLEGFLADYPQLLKELCTDVRGYRPAEAVIDLPAQGALEFLNHLARLARHKAERSRVQYSVGSIEFFHLVKLGNNIKTMAAGRVAPRPYLLDGYRSIVGEPGHPSPYRNPLFRRGLMLALLNEQGWYQPFAAFLSERPWPFFIRCQESPRATPWFAADAARRFEEEFKELQREKTAMSQPNVGAPRLPLLIHRIVRDYVNRRTEEKSGLKWDDFKDNKVKDESGRERINVPQPYRDAKEKIASSVFLEMRSRREQDFVDHFTRTFCSVKQFLSEADFAEVARALLESPDDVKTLTLLALSANS
jgi:CRISPR-associated protein Cmx8